MKEEIESVIDKARRAIQSSKREFNSGDFDYACSRAYYAVFYLIEGVLMINLLCLSLIIGKIGGMIPQAVI